jgi:hypothetical protein
MDDLAPRVSKSFDVAQEVVKQLIALATAVVTVTITFLTDVLGSAPSGAKILLGAAWLVYLLSILLGVATLMSISGTLSENTQPSIYAGSIRLTAGIQVGLFLLATGLAIAFAIWALL